MWIAMKLKEILSFLIHTWAILHSNQDQATIKHGSVVSKQDRLQHSNAVELRPNAAKAHTEKQRNATKYTDLVK